MAINGNNYIVKYLSNNQPFVYDGIFRESTLFAALRECRLFTKRNKETGEYNPECEFGFEGHWLGSIGYFSILDQIGSSFKPQNIPHPSGKYNSIQFAIESFGYDLLENDKKKLHALIALRNAFTHDFCLINIPENKKKYSLEKRRFSVGINYTEIVTLPLNDWEEDISQKNIQNTKTVTKIDLLRFGNMVETIVSRVRYMAKNNMLDTLIDIPTFMNKYTFVILS